MKTEEKEMNMLRNGFLTLKLLKTIKDLPKVGMSPFYGLLVQEITKINGLGTSPSLIHPRLKLLKEEGYLSVTLGKSSNPRAKKPIYFYKITKLGSSLLAQLEKEVDRIRQNLS